LAYSFSRISSLIGATTAINGVITQIESAVNSVLARTDPDNNQMSVDLDMNSNRILNLPAPSSGTEPARYQDVSAAIAAGTAAQASATAAASSATTASTALSTFQNVYYGSYAAAPTTRPDSTARVAGDLYYNTTLNQLYIFSSGAWTAAALSASGVLVAVNNLSDLTNTATARTNIGLGNVPNVDATNASNSSSGTLPGSRLPAFTGGDVTSSAGSLVLSIASGVVTFAKLATAALATTAQYLANTASLVLTTDKVWGAAVTVPLTDAATVTSDHSTGINFSVTFGGNRTLANPTNMKVGQCGSYWITQDATGSRTITWGSNWKTAGGTGATLSTAANAVDRIDYIVRSASIIEYSITKGIA